jgi:hypothetical protein
LKPAKKTALCKVTPVAMAVFSKSDKKRQNYLIFWQEEVKAGKSIKEWPLEIALAGYNSLTGSMPPFTKEKLQLVTKFGNYLACPVYLSS